ncbi:hypothetical protein F5148DRAFT_578661 [Russula earlei]|uniref:Uncharacterized protein n=1 Tax=Russula earlei TaxID=71964 RepID=A0ACC0UFK9_9AGAM|nr:hypothetical protein F5148DRAFT_578661 [Russula earlei]
MADGDDDYLSDKFLTVAEPQKPKTYSEKRKESLRQSLRRNEQNRAKSRRQLELESREEGLSSSLFERAEDDQSSGRGPENKALSMMMKMGFKPGDALGVPANVEEGTPTSLETREGRLVNPLPLKEWAGKKGIGLGKRAPSPSELERLAKVARAAEESDKETFRDRSRREFEQRRAEARLGPAQRTCATLDERAGKEFNVLWFDPTNPDAFPAGLAHAVLLEETAASAAADDEDDEDDEGDGVRDRAWGSGSERLTSTEERLRAQMRADALGPLDDDEEILPKDAGCGGPSLPPATIKEAAGFFRLNAVERLDRVLQYLRVEYHYCFWCGTQYKSLDEMEEECPGSGEDMHD